MIERLLPKSTLVRHILTLMTGTTIAQAIPVAVSPLLTRLYSSEELGMLALFMAICQVVAVVATWRYELAVMLPQIEHEANHIVRLSVCISLIMCGLSMLVIALLHSEILGWLDAPELGLWLYTIPLWVLCTGIYQSINYWLMRRQQYDRVVASRTLQSGANAGVQLGLGYYGLRGAGLILGSLLGLLASTVYMSIRWWRGQVGSRLALDIPLMLELAKRYRKLPLYNLPNAMIDSLRLSGIQILIDRYYGAATLGQFSMAWKLVQIPMGLLSHSISQVLFQHTASIDRTRLYPMVVKYIVYSSLLGIPIFGSIFYCSEPLFGWIYGSEWRMAGRAASVIAPWLYMNFVSSPLTYLYTTLNKQDYLLAFSIVYMAYPLGVLMITQKLSFEVTLGYVSMGMAVILAVFILATVYIAYISSNDKDS